MPRRRARRVLVAAVAICAAVGWVAFVTSSAGAETPNVTVAGILDDSPLYEFGGPGTPPVRDVPVAVAWLSAKTSAHGLVVDVTQLARFDSTPIGARVSFYPRRPSIRVTGGFEFSLGTDAVNAVTVEQVSPGTATSAEVWKVEQGLANVKVTYSFPTTTLRIDAQGKYLKMLRDPFTAVGLDLYRGENSTLSIQPSARVSIGDLTGAHPGLTAAQGTAIADDFSPQPWITRPVSSNFVKRVDKYLHTSSGPLSVYDVGAQNATVRLWALGRDAEQIRFFVAPKFQPVQPGSRFEPYTIIVFSPTDTSAPLRRGDAYSSTPATAANVLIKKRKNDFVVDFPEQMRTDLVGTQVVVPGDSGKVLLATSLHHRF
jgi:hypothetical protein